MKRAFFPLLLLLCLLAPSHAEAMRKWEYVNPQEIEIRITPEKAEITAGEVATFTISIRNRTDKAVNIPFATGQRWDLAVWHYETQIYRWSQGKYWSETPHSIPVRPGVNETYKLAWRSIDRNSCALPQGDYRIVGMVMTQPRFLCSNTTRVRLLPPKLVPGKLVKVRLAQAFELDLPTFFDREAINWKIEFDYNDNRVMLIGQRQTSNTVTYVFNAERPGHVMMRLYAFPLLKDVTCSLERRSYRVEVVSGD